MSVLTDIWRQLVQRRLWPVAVLLIAALVAVPLLLAKDPEPTVEAAAPAPANAARRGRRARGADRDRDDHGVALARPRRARQGARHLQVDGQAAEGGEVAGHGAVRARRRRARLPTPAAPRTAGAAAAPPIRSRRPRRRRRRPPSLRRSRRSTRSTRSRSASAAPRAGRGLPAAGHRAPVGRQPAARLRRAARGREDRRLPRRLDASRPSATASASPTPESCETVAHAGRRDRCSSTSSTAVGRVGRAVPARPARHLQEATACAQLEGAPHRGVRRGGEHGRPGDRRAGPGSARRCEPRPHRLTRSTTLQRPPGGLS